MSFDRSAFFFSKFLCANFLPTIACKVVSMYAPSLLQFWRTRTCSVAVSVSAAAKQNYINNFCSTFAINQTNKTTFARPVK